MTHGSLGASGYSPCAAITSAKFSPAARTRIRTWPGPGSGSAVSRTSRPSGPPAQVVFQQRERAGKARELHQGPVDHRGNVHPDDPGPSPREKNTTHDEA